jgi:hypothetical protein
MALQSLESQRERTDVVDDLMNYISSDDDDDDFGFANVDHNNNNNNNNNNNRGRGGTTTTRVRKDLVAHLEDLSTGVRQHKRDKRVVENAVVDAFKLSPLNRQLQQPLYDEENDDDDHDGRGSADLSSEEDSDADDLAKGHNNSTDEDLVEYNVGDAKKSPNYRKKWQWRFMHPLQSILDECRAKILVVSRSPTVHTGL